MSRGLAGHSMGGYGALRIGMKRPDVFLPLPHEFSAASPRTAIRIRKQWRHQKRSRRESRPTKRHAAAALVPR